MKKVSVMIIAAVLSAALAIPVSAQSQPISATFSAAIRAEFVNFFRWAHREDYYEYDRFALHDFDGDGIPEVLMGMSDPANPLFARYDVVKFPNNGLENANFKIIGTIGYSRYLMCDRFSGSVLALAGSPSSVGDYTEINNYYISNAIIQVNNLLRREGVSYTLLGTPITAQEFNLELYNYFGTYIELVTHDTFTRSVIESVVYNWQPHAIATGNVRRLSNDTTLTKKWQVEYEKVIRNMTAPYPTMFDPYELTAPNQQRYMRYSLYDFDSDQLPELLIGVMHGTKYSFDVYKFINGAAKFVGSFDSYTLMLRSFDKSNHLYCLDPQPELIDYEQGKDYFSYRDNPSTYNYSRSSLIFNFENINAVYYYNGLSQINLMSTYPDDEDPTLPTYRNKANVAIKPANARTNTVNYILVSGDELLTEEKYLAKVREYSGMTIDIPTYDIFIVPPSAIFATWRPHY